jgi:outer membrane protein
MKLDMFKPLRLRSLTLALLCASLPGFAAAEDLLQVYQIARSADPTLATVEAQKRSVGEGVAQARSALLPQISGSAGMVRDDSSQRSTGLSVINGQIGTGLFGSSALSYSRRYVLQANQTLFDFSKLSQLHAAHASADAGESNYTAAEQNLILRVTINYFAVLTSEDALLFSQANEKALARQLDQAEQRFEVGLSAITDVHDARAKHDSAVAGTIDAKNAVDDAREALTEIIAKPIGDLKHLRDILPMDAPTPNDPEAWVALALKQNPALASGQHSVDAAEYSIQTQRSGHLPTLTASFQRSDIPSWGDGSQFESGSGFSGHTNGLSGNTSVGVSLNIPIFTGGFTSSRVRQAIADRDTAQDQFETQRRTIVHQTRTAYRAVVAGISEVQARKQAVVSAQSALDATRAGFEVGTRTIVDVLLSQQGLLQAQSDYSQARHGFVINGLKLKDFAGSIAPKDLEAVNSLLE